MLALARHLDLPKVDILAEASTGDIRLEGRSMLRWGLRLLLAAVVLSAIGFITNGYYAVFEVIRGAGGHTASE